MTLSIYSLDEARRLPIDWPDIYFTPGFGRVSEISDGGVWHVAIWGDGKIIYPFLRREIEGSNHFDITSPYGFAGIHIRECVELSEISRFRTEFRNWAREAGIVAEFLRMSSLRQDQSRVAQADPVIAIKPHNSTVLINVDTDYDTYFAHNEGRSRTAVRKARKLGYTSEIKVADAAFFEPGAPFGKLYHETMTRVAAKPYYFFSDSYFQTIHAELGEHVYSVIARNAAGHIAMSGFIFVWKEYIHLHLNGSTREGLRDGVGNFFYDAFAAWGCENPQIKWMHVGGGQSEDDSLYRFKLSFGGTPTDYYLGRSMLNQEVYDKLVADRAAVLSTDIKTLIDSGFFPAYRANPS